MFVSDFRKLHVWVASQELVVVCYRATDSFPKPEEYGLKSQIRRSAVSIPANIAEGSGRHSDRDFMRFLRIAGGSAGELESLVGLARTFEFMSPASAQQIEERVIGVRKMMAGLYEPRPLLASQIAGVWGPGSGD